MQHKIPPGKYGPLTELMAGAVDSCVHCGFCLPACPTYQVLGEEMDSPRGRILLMKSVLEGDLGIEEATPYLDRCLGCDACVTACPSGVAYGNLITPFRMVSNATRRRTLEERLVRALALSTLPYPARFRLASWFGRYFKPLAPLLPKRLGAMMTLLPAAMPKSQPLPELYPAQGTRRGRVALLAGCAQRILAPDINWSALRVLARNGIEVVIPATGGCCGALAAHTGEAGQARVRARATIKAFPRDVDAVVSTAAGCGSGMKEYAMWLHGEPDEAAAAAFAGQVQDVSVYLASLDLEPIPAMANPMVAAYHDACHLAHAQKVVLEPRRLLSQVPNLKIVEVPDGEYCCGSAGIYNIEQPDLASELGTRKAANIAATKAEVVVTGNIGCMTQLEAHLRGAPRPIPVLHTLQVIDRAYRGVPVV